MLKRMNNICTDTMDKICGDFSTLIKDLLTLIANWKISVCKKIVAVIITLLLVRYIYNYLVIIFLRALFNTIGYPVCFDFDTTLINLVVYYKWVCVNFKDKETSEKTVTNIFVGILQILNKINTRKNGSFRIKIIADYVNNNLKNPTKTLNELLIVILFALISCTLNKSIFIYLPEYFPMAVVNVILGVYKFIYREWKYRRVHEVTFLLCLYTSTVMVVCPIITYYWRTHLGSFSGILIILLSIKIDKILRCKKENLS